MRREAATARERVAAIPEWAVCAALVLLVVVVFGRVAGFSFLTWDDPMFVCGAALSPPTWTFLVAGWAGPLDHLYIPMARTAWWLLAWVGQTSDRTPSPAIFHAASVVVHGLNALCVYFLIRRVRTGRRAGGVWPAFAGAAMFAVHPVQVESVAWASELKDLLAGAFSISALWMYVSAVRKGGIGWWMGCAILVTLAVWSKPSAVMVPVLMGVIDWLLLGSAGAGGQAGSKKTRGERKSVRLAVMLGVILPWVIVARLSQSGAAFETPAWWLRPLVMVDAIHFYVLHVVVPVVVVPDYARSPGWVLGQGWWWHVMHAGVVGTVLGAMCLCMKRNPAVAAGILMFVLAPFPVLGVFPFDFQVYSTVADHYLYAGMVGIALVVAGIIGEVDRPVWRIAGVAVAGALAVAAFAATEKWSSDVLLWRETLVQMPESGLAHFGYAVAVGNGESLAARIDHLQKAAARCPSLPVVHRNLSILLFQAGQVDDAIAESERQMSLEEQYGDGRLSREQIMSRYALGRLLLERGRKKEAKVWFEKVLQVDQGNRDALAGLAEATKSE